MSLLQDYSHHFKPDVIKRGEQYQKDGAVEILDHGQDFVAADVTGSEVYNVSIGFDPNIGATFDCTCAYFEEYGPCKHCWAGVLEAFQQGVLPGMNPDSDEPTPAAGKLRRVGADGADTNDDGTDGDGDGESNSGESDDPNDPRQRLQRELGSFLGGVSPGDLLRTLRPAKGGIRAETTGVKPSDDAWKNQLKRLSDSMAARPTLAPKPLNWPKGRRILYVIDEAATLDSGLTLVLMQETPKREGVYEQPRGLRLTQFQIPQLPDPVDRQIIQLLNGAARSGFGYYHYDSPLPEKCEIDEAATEDILRQLRHRAVSADGR